MAGCIVTIESLRRRRAACGRLAIVVCLTLLTSCVGCGQEEELVPVRGVVFYKGRPLEFGSVMLQPASGDAAVAAIQSDGSFELETIDQGKGAAPGKYKVRVACYEAQRPSSVQTSRGEVALGKSLIPDRYASYGSSGLEVEVTPGVVAPLELRLTD